MTILWHHSSKTTSRGFANNSAEILRFVQTPFRLLTTWTGEIKKPQQQNEDTSSTRNAKKACWYLQDRHASRLRITLDMLRLVQPRLQRREESGPRQDLVPQKHGGQRQRRSHDGLHLVVSWFGTGVSIEQGKPIGLVRGRWDWWQVKYIRNKSSVATLIGELGHLFLVFDLLCWLVFFLRNGGELMKKDGWLWGLRWEYWNFQHSKM